MIFAYLFEYDENKDNKNNFQQNLFCSFRYYTGQILVEYFLFY